MGIFWAKRVHFACFLRQIRELIYALIWLKIPIFHDICVNLMIFHVISCKTTKISEIDVTQDVLLCAIMPSFTSNFK